MSLDSSEAAAGYHIPTYRAPEGTTWFHVLHGNIPNHQIDFMYGPDVPQGQLTPTHFSHMTRLMKYIEPQTHASHAFAIANLSRDDTQHEPGHGALGLIFGMRIGGATDHAGRQNPPFAHGILTVDRDLNYATLLEAAATFYRHVMYAGEAQSTTSDFYKAYVRTMVERPDEVEQVLSRYVEDFGDLPRLRRSALGFDWECDEDALPRRVVIVHPDGEAFGTIAHAAAKIASLLYRSNIKWTAISTGREADIPGGVSVRFYGERDVSGEDRRGVQLHRLEELPEDEAELAQLLFAARPRGSGEEQQPRRYVGWREKFASQLAPEEALAQTGGQKRPALGSTPDAEPRRDPRANKTTESGTEIMARAPAAELVERGLIPKEAAAPTPKNEGEARPGREKSGRYPAAAGAAASGAADSGAAAKKADPAKAAAASPAEWRDVGSAPASGRGKKAAASGGDDIEITVEPPAGSSSSKKWVWMLLGVAAVAAVAAVMLGQVPGVGPGAGTTSETPATNTAPPTPAPTRVETPPPQPTATDTPAPGATQTPAPKETATTPATPVTAPAGTATSTGASTSQGPRTGPTTTKPGKKPPNKKGGESIFEKPLNL